MTKRISVRNLEVGQYIKKGYSSDDNLLVTDYRVESKEDLDRLHDIGLSYCLIPDQSFEEPLDTEEGSPEGLEPEEVLDKELQRIPTLVDKTQKLYHDATDELQLIFESVHERDDREFIRLESLNPYFNHLINFIDESPASVSVLTQIESYDESTLNHSLNVALFSMIYGDHIGLSDSKLQDLGFGALLHDVGKTNFSRRMVEKNDELGEKEWEVVRNHPEKGKQILSELGAREIAGTIAYEHHERPDGSGYPEGKTDIHHFSRIVSVFDVYEALTAPRAHKDPINPLEAYQTLKSSFSDYPETRQILQGMIRSLGFFPVGCIVRLSNKDLAVVHRNHPENLRRPAVKVIKRGDDRSVERPYTVDLNHIRQQKELINDRIYEDTIEITEVYGLNQAPNLKETVTTIFRNQGFGINDGEG